MSRTAPRPSRRPPRVESRWLVEYVGLDPDSREFVTLSETLHHALASYPKLKRALDAYPTVQRRALVKLSQALDKLDDGTRLLLDGADSFDAEVRNAINTLDWIIHYDGAKHRPTLTARDYIANDIARAFKAHYALEKRDYAGHLCDLLRAAFAAWDIPCPATGEYDGNRPILQLLSSELREI